LKNAP